MQATTSKGISTVIAELLIVSMAIAMSIVVIGYVMGWFSGASGGTSSIYIYPDSEFIIDYKNRQSYAILHLYSSYKPEIKITHIYVDEGDAKDIEVIKVVQGRATVERGSVVLDDGTEVYLKVVFNLTNTNISPTIDNKKEVRIVTDQGILVKGFMNIKTKK